MERLGLGRKLQADRSLVEQIEESLERILSKKREAHKSTLWKTLLSNHLKRLGDHRLERNF